MQWEWIVVLVVAIPVILFPAAYVWYINIKGLTNLIKDARMKKAARDRAFKKNTVEAQEYERALIKTLEKYPW